MNAPTQSGPLLEVTDLRTHFHTRNGVVRAVDGISFHVAPGETLGIVGESGSGKSVACLSLLGLIPTPPGRIESGAAMFAGIDLLHAAPRELRAIRGREIAMIFQDPMTALNPFMRIGKQLVEPLLIHTRASKADARKQALEALRTVGISDAPRHLDEYPHQLSGGMRQRVMIAMALITRPKLLIADEPTTALDVTVQAQILELIRMLQAEFGMAVIFITHDLGVIADVCDRVHVMYAGTIVEKAPVAGIFRAPRHPYTQALLESIPSIHQKGEELASIPGLPPDLIEPIAGCPFAPRCTFAQPECRTEFAGLRQTEEQQASACLRVQRGEIELATPRRHENATS